MSNDPVGSHASARDWLEAGQWLLRQGGAAAVKLAPLTARMGLTTGSFYHHFINMAEFRDQLARFWGADQTERNLASVNAVDPRARLRALVALAQERRMGALDAAMRDWAGSNPIAAASVRETDRHLLEFMATAFVELGASQRDAQLRAHLLMSIGVARVLPPWDDHPDDIEAILDILQPR